MSDAKGSLALYLKLDELSAQGGVIDGLGNDYDDSLVGDPQLIVDDAFGSCLRFDGKDDFVDTGLLFPEIQGTFTMAAWVCPEGERPSENQQDTGVQGGNQPYIVWPTHGDNAYQAGHSAAGISVGTNGVSVYEHGAGYRPALLVWDGAVTGWTHIAVVYYENKPSLYVNGKLKKEGLQSTKTVHPSAGKGDAYPKQVGGIGGGHTGYFKGKISHFRIYSEALSADRIKQDMAADQTAIASFTKAHPLDFKLYEGDDKEPIVFIENGMKGESLTLELCNQSEQEIRFPVLSGDVSKDNDNYHFKLLFRAGTLSQDSLARLAVAESSDWQMKQESDSDGMVSLYFLWMGSEPRSLERKATESLTLLHVNGAIAGGTRTTRVEFWCRSFDIGPQDAQETVTDYFREQTLNFVNHRGKKNIPLHVGFIGSNRILNDGKQHNNNELALRITNVLKGQAINLIPEGQGNGASRFIVSCDVQTQGTLKEWALLETGQVAGINVKYDGREIPNSAEQGESPEWIISFGQRTTVEAGEHIEFKVANIITSLPSGHANLYIHYENIPGYWDGQFICTVEKSPLIIQDDRVGIGITEPKKALHIQGSQFEAPIISGDDGDKFDRPGLAITGNYPQLDLFSNADNAKHGATIRLGGYDNTEHKTFKHWVIGTAGENASSLDIGFAENKKNPHAGLANYDGTTVLKLTKREFTVEDSTRPPNTITTDKNPNEEALFNLSVAGDVTSTGTVSANKFVGPGALVTGMIMMWYGKPLEVPEGWALCDGQIIQEGPLKGQKTPDLKDRFVLGVADVSKVRDTGGAPARKLEMKHIPKIPEHRHRIYAQCGDRFFGLMSGDNSGIMEIRDTGDVPEDYESGGQVAKDSRYSATNLLATSYGGESGKRDNESFEIMPPYYTLAYIMKL